MKFLLTSAGISNESVRNALANLEKLAATLSVPSYLIDDQTAMTIIDGTIEVISEGNWKLINS